ncbi:MAG: MFS transporter, partial [Actinomycetota bacterium]
PEPDAELVGRIWHSKVAWAVAIAFTVSTFSVYALFAWLPELLVQTAGVTPTQAGALLALNSVVGAPSAILMPLLTIRIRRVAILIWVGVAFLVIAYLGLLLSPGAGTIIWVLLAGAGPLIFPVCLTLINLRSRTQRGSIALSGFAQSVGYFLGALGPLLLGVLHSATGGWVAPLILLIVVSLPAAFVAPILSRPAYVEDEIEASHRRRLAAKT